MLKIQCADLKKWNGKGQTLASFVFEEHVPTAAKEDGFKGKELSSFLYRPEGHKPAERVLLIGLGKKSEFVNETLRRAASRALRGEMCIRDSNYSGQHQPFENATGPDGHRHWRDVQIECQYRQFVHHL